MNNPIGISLLRFHLLRTKKLGIEIVIDEKYNLPLPDATPLILKAKQMNCDILFSNGLFPDGVMTMRAAKALNYNPKAIVQDIGSVLPAWVNELGVDGNYVFSGTPLHSKLKYPGNDRLNAYVKEKFNLDEYPVYFGFGYCWMQVLGEAVEGAKSLDQTKIRDWLRANTVNTIGGPMKFDEKGLPPLIKFTTQVINGKVELVWPKDVQTARARISEAGMEIGEVEFSGDGMESILVIQSLISGIMMGVVYALLGLGFSLSWGVMNVINISHATFGLLGAFLAYAMLKWWGLDPFVSLAVTTPLLFGAACFIYRILIAPITKAKEVIVSSMILTFGIAIVLENVMLIVWGPDPRLLTTSYTNKVLMIGPIFLQYPRLAAFLMSVAGVVLIYLFLKKTYTGKAVRAAWQQPDAAQLYGVNLKRISMITFGLAVASSGAGGVGMAMLYSFEPHLP